MKHIVGGVFFDEESNGIRDFILGALVFEIRPFCDFRIRKKLGQKRDLKLIESNIEKHLFLFIRGETRHVIYTRMCILNCRIISSRSQPLKLSFQKVTGEKRFLGPKNEFFMAIF